MPRSGPAKTPTRLRIVRGSKPSLLNHAEPQPIPGAPTMPADMGEPSRAVWAEVMREFGHTEVIRGADAEILRLYCDAVVRYRQAQGLYAQTGPLIQQRDHGGMPAKNPLHQIVRDNATLVRSLAAELGLTPAARASLQATPRVDASYSRMASLTTARRRTG